MRATTPVSAARSRMRVDAIQIAVQGGQATRIDSRLVHAGGVIIADFALDDGAGGLGVIEFSRMLCRITRLCSCNSAKRPQLD